MKLFFLIIFFALSLNTVAYCQDVECETVSMEALLEDKEKYHDAIICVHGCIRYLNKIASIFPSKNDELEESQKIYTIRDYGHDNAFFVGLTDRGQLASLDRKYTSYCTIKGTFSSYDHLADGIYLGAILDAVILECEEEP